MICLQSRSIPEDWEEDITRQSVETLRMENGSTLYHHVVVVVAVVVVIYIVVVVVTVLSQYKQHEMRHAFEYIKFL